MSGERLFPTGEQAFAPGTGAPQLGTTPGGPSPGQFLAAFQAIVQALNGESAALNALLALVIAQTAPKLVLTEIVAPAAPTSGAIIYVDSTTHLLMGVDSIGNRVALT